MLAKIAMIAITTNNSINVKAPERLLGGTTGLNFMNSDLVLVNRASLKNRPSPCQRFASSLSI